MVQLFFGIIADKNFRSVTMMGSLENRFLEFKLTENFNMDVVYRVEPILKFLS